jgi:hypothetical protein
VLDGLIVFPYSYYYQVLARSNYLRLLLEDNNPQFCRSLDQGISSICGLSLSFLPSGSGMSLHHYANVS